MQDPSERPADGAREVAVGLPDVLVLPLRRIGDDHIDGAVRDTRKRQGVLCEQPHALAVGRLPREIAAVLGPNRDPSTTLLDRPFQPCRREGAAPRERGEEDVLGRGPGGGDEYRRHLVRRHPSPCPGAAGRPRELRESDLFGHPPELDSAETKVHMIDQLVAAVAKDIDWDELTAGAVRTAYDRAGFPAEGDLTVDKVAGLHGVDATELYRNVRRGLEQAVLGDTTLNHEFRVAMLRLAQAVLGRQDVEPSERDAVLGATARWCC